MDQTTQEDRGTDPLTQGLSRTGAAVQVAWAAAQRKRTPEAKAAAAARLKAAQWAHEQWLVASGMRA